MVVPERRPRVYVVFRGLVKNNALPEGTWQLSRPVPKAAAINYRVSIWAMRIKLSLCFMSYKRQSARWHQNRLKNGLAHCSNIMLRG